MAQATVSTASSHTFVELHGSAPAWPGEGTQAREALRIGQDAKRQRVAPGGSPLATPTALAVVNR